MRKIIITVLFVCFSFLINAQSTFSTQIKTGDRQNNAFSIIQIDSGFIMSGFGLKSLSHYSHIFLIKVDSIGDTLFNKRFYADSAYLYPGFSNSLTKNKIGYNLGGSRKDSIGKALLLLFNNNDDTIRTISYPYIDTIPFTIASQSKETLDRGYILIGEQSITGQYNRSLFNVIKTDSLGNMEWMKDYGLPNTVNRGENILLTPDGGYLLGGNTFLNFYDALVIKIDSLGNEQWHKVIGGPNNDGFARLALAKDSNYVVATTYSVYDDFGSPDSRVRILKLDTAGNILWDKQYVKPQAERRVNSIKALDKGGFIICGDAFRDTVISYHRGFLMRFDENGDSLWYRQYANYSEPMMLHELYDVIQTTDGGFAACGDINDDYNNAFYDIWLLKTDSMGNAPGCQYVGFESEKAKGEKLKIKVYPNPARDFITVDLSDFTQYENLSLHITNSEHKELEIVTVERNANHKRIDLRNYPTGVYFIRLQSGTEILGVEKIIKT